jgi:phosphohistidine phosphatase
VDVYLVRHAIAAARDPVRWPDDSQRPLTQKGEARFREAARGLRRIVDGPEIVLSSPYPRAWRTAELLEEEAGWRSPVGCPELEAERPATAALEPLARSTATSVALVGHEPYLSALASLLLTGDEAALRLEVKKGGVVHLVLSGEPTPRRAVLGWSASPRLLRALARDPVS